MNDPRRVQKFLSAGAGEGRGIVLAGRLRGLSQALGGGSGARWRRPNIWIRFWTTGNFFPSFRMFVKRNGTWMPRWGDFDTSDGGAGAIPPLRALCGRWRRKRARAFPAGRKD